MQAILIRLFVFSAAYLLATQVSAPYLHNAGDFATVWPASGVALSVLMLTHRREWPLYLGVLFIIQFWAEGLAGSSTLFSCILNSVALTMEPLFSAIFLRKLFGESVRLERSAEMVSFIGVCCLVIVLLTALGPALYQSVTFEVDFLKAWWQWSIGSAVGILIITPLVITVYYRLLETRRIKVNRRNIEFVLVSLFAAGLTWVVFGRNNPSGDMLPNYAYLILPPLIYVAMRFGTFGAAMSNALVFGAALTGDYQREAQSVELSSALSATLWVESFLFIAFSVVLLLAATIAERNQTSRLREAVHARGRKQQKALVQVLKIDIHNQTEFESALRKLLQIYSKTLSVERVSFWEINGDGDLLCTLGQQGRNFSTGDILSARVYPHYFAALESKIPIDAEDTKQDKRTRELVASGYIAENDIGAMLDVSVYASDKLAGVLCAEHVGGVREWGKDEVVFSMAVAEQINRIRSTVARFLFLEKQDEMRQRLANVEKMEALGGLTQGLAHDYNNILTVISGSCEMYQITPDELEKGELIDIILNSTEKGRRLTNRLLRFASRRSIEVGEVDLNMLISDLGTVLKLSISNAVNIEIKHETEPCQVLVNAGEVQDALLNLAVNAAHAVEEKNENGGEIKLRVETKFVDGHVDTLPAGDYACVSIEDNGTGIEEEDIDRLFQPFFTTKGERGTGLGLSQVRTLMHQYKGEVDVITEINLGTTFTLYFPCLDNIHVPDQ